MSHRHDRLRVVVAGGGVAALETVLALHASASVAVEITLLTPERQFVYRPVTVAEAFGAGEARSYSVLGLVEDRVGGRVVWDTVAGVSADDRLLMTGSGQRIGYDALVVATGARPRPSIPGALTFRGREDVAALHDVLEELIEGRSDSLAFALPNEHTWPLPIYELALLAAAAVGRERQEHARLLLVTPEREPLELFGREAAVAVEPLLEARGIELHRSALPVRVEGRTLALAGGAALHADRVVTLPVFEGPRLPGLPHDRDGFIPVDEYGRVAGVTDVFAVGDATSFPIKQGGLAAQQADAAASAIAAKAGAAIRPHRFNPILRGLLLTGAAPLYLRYAPLDKRHGLTATVNGEGLSSAAGSPLWWPPAKVAARHLAPYLASAPAEPVAVEVLRDRTPIPGPPVSQQEDDDAFELALLLADCDARWGDYRSALDALAAAEAAHGTLPSEYEAKRHAWTAARRVGD